MSSDTPKPATPLPWKPIPSWDGLIGKDGCVVFADELFTKDDDLRYIAHACNAYPELTAAVERLRKIDAALVKYRRKEREILNLPEDAREEDHLERMRHIIRQHKEVDAAYAVASDGKAFWKAECDKLKAELAEIKSLLFDSIHGVNFMHDQRAICFQMQGKYDGAMSSACKDSFAKQYEVWDRLIKELEEQTDAE